MLQEFRKRLLAWFDENKRNLPWRKNRTPYKIWLSEIILQQTRVQQGLPYYQRFIEKYPSVDKLAKADQQEVLKMWQGLGYYSRARNLHTAAQQVMEEFGGYFPSGYKDLKKLKGVGDYTASAISSFATDEKVPVLDGNVKRVLSRIYNESTPINTSKGEKTFHSLAEKTLDPDYPGKFNEAIMEFGALQCTVNPKCTICPVSSYCEAFQQGTQKHLPVKEKPRPRKDRFFHYFLVEKNQCILLQKRQAGDIWEGLFELPLTETQSKTTDFAKIPEFQSTDPDKIRYLCSYEHILTHRRIIASFYEIKAENLTGVFENSFWAALEKVDKYPFPKLIENFFSEKHPH